MVVSQMVKKPILYSFSIDKPLGHKKKRKMEIKKYRETAIIILVMNYFILETLKTENDFNRVIFTFTLQQTKFFFNLILYTL